MYHAKKRGGVIENATIPKVFCGRYRCLVTTEKIIVNIFCKLFCGAMMGQKIEYDFRLNKDSI